MNGVETVAWQTGSVISSEWDGTRTAAVHHYVVPRGADMSVARRCPLQMGAWGMVPVRWGIGETLS